MTMVIINIMIMTMMIMMIIIMMILLTPQVTEEGAGGLVSARDFVYGARHVRRHGR